MYYKFTKSGALALLNSGSKFPDELDFGNGGYFGESHSIDRGKDMHQLITYEAEIFRDKEIEVVGRYNYCQECKKVRNKLVVVFYKDQGKCTTKYFIKHGEAVY